MTTQIEEEHALGLLERSRLEVNSGNFDQALNTIQPLWRGLGHPPHYDSLSLPVKAELFLRAGALAGWIGISRHDKAAQTQARELLEESIALFQSLGKPEKVCEAKIDLALCDYREAKFEEARQIIRGALETIGDLKSPQRARAYINQAVIANASGRLRDSLKILTDHAAFIESFDDDSLLGRFHNTLANVLHYLGTAEMREDFLDRAFVEYAAAAYHFEQAKYLKGYVLTQNQLSYLSLITGKIKEAHEYLDSIEHLMSRVHDKETLSMLQETRAQIFLAENRTAEAAELLQPIIRSLEKGGDILKLTEALTTWGTLLARTGRYDQSRHSLEQATTIAEEVGDKESAARALLTILEELGDSLQIDDQALIYERADRLLTDTQHPRAVARLRKCARQIINRPVAAAVPGSGEMRFIHASAESAKLLRHASRLAHTEGAVLITGETGTGKEFLARLIHEWSRSSGEFKVINCAFLSGTPFEVDFMNFTNGTLFLDEICDLSATAQAKLLRLLVLSEQHAPRSISEYLTGRKIIASTARNMDEELSKGYFRPDLYYRLETFKLEIPPLRYRQPDIPLLAEHFIQETSRRYGKLVRFTTQALIMMQRLPLRGNVRELRALIEKTISAAPDDASITADQVETLNLRQTPVENLNEPWANCSLEAELLKYEGDLIALALKSTGGHLTNAAGLLGLSHQNLSSIIKSRQRQLLNQRSPVKRRRTKRNGEVAESTPE